MTDTDTADSLEDGLGDVTLLEERDGNNGGGWAVTGAGEVSSDPVFVVVEGLGPWVGILVVVVIGTGDEEWIFESNLSILRDKSEFFTGIIRSSDCNTNLVSSYNVNSVNIFGKTEISSISINNDEIDFGVCFDQHVCPLLPLLLGGTLLVTATAVTTLLSSFSPTLLPLLPSISFFGGVAVIFTVGVLLFPTYI